MRKLSRVWVSPAVAAVVLLGLLALGGPLASVAQDATPVAADRHPLVGAWIVATVEDPGAAPTVTAFTGDGLVVDGCCGGTARVGAWAATGPRSADYTHVTVLPGGEGAFAGSVVLRISAEVDVEGTAFAGPYSYTIVAPDGTVVETGRGTARGVRMEAEPAAAAGTPLAAMPLWGAATPAAGAPTP